MSDQEDLFNNSSSSNSEKEKTSIKKVSTKKAKPKKKPVAKKLSPISKAKDKERTQAIPLKIQEAKPEKAAVSKKQTIESKSKVNKEAQDAEKRIQEAKEKGNEKLARDPEKLEKVETLKKKEELEVAEELEIAEQLKKAEEIDKAEQKKKAEGNKLLTEEAIRDKDLENQAKRAASLDKAAKILASGKKNKDIVDNTEVSTSDKNEPTNKEDRFLILTHRVNLLAIMSSGLIGPKEVYGKYRDDILVHTKGLVPLFSRNISTQLIDLTTTNKDSNFPVVLELDKARIPDSFAFGVNSKGEIVENVNKNDSFVFRLTTDILSTNMIKEVHFISEQSLKDFQARMFENVPIKNFSLSESPKIFDSKSAFPVQFFENITTNEFDNIDRVSRISDKTAASIALFAENMERGSDLKLLHSLLDFPYQGNKSRMKDEYDTFAELVSALITGKNQNNNLSNDYYLLSAVLEELINHNPSDGWVPLTFLEKVESKYKASLVADDNQLDKFFETCRSIFNSTMEIPGGIFSDDQNIIQRAILLFILRPDYNDLIGKENSQLNPGTFVKKIAILITGFRAGYERININFKDLHHQIFAPLRAYIINYGLGNRHDSFKIKPKAIVDWDSDERVYTYKYRLLKETIRGELSIKSYIHDVIQKMLDQDHIHEDFEILDGTLDYRFEYLESGSERKQPVNLDFDSVQDNLIISSPCFEITSPSHQKRITKVILQKIFAEDYDGKAYWIYEKNKSITLKRVIHHDEIANIDIVDLINFIAKTADEVEEKLFKQDKVR